MPADSAKRVFQDLRRQSPILRVSDRQYKLAYSKTVRALVEEVVEENERLEKKTEMLEDMLKFLVNQSQLGVSEIRNLRKALVENTAQLAKLKELPPPESNDDESEEIDLKGE